MRKNKLNMLIVQLLFLLLIIIGCMEKPLKYESRGNTVKRYLRYCTYEIWDGFVEILDYRFKIITEDKENYISIRLEELPKTDKLDNLIDWDIAKHKVELKEHKEDKYFSDVHRHNIRIGNNPAIVVSYEFNKVRKKGERRFNNSLRRIENCYIKLNDKTLLLRGSTFADSYNETVKNLWEEFYKSYRADDSQGFKTNYGSFKWVNNLEDDSRVKYYAFNKDGATTYSIDIFYSSSEEDKIKRRKENSFTEKIFQVLDAKAYCSKIRSDKLIIDGYTIEYSEFSTVIDSETIKMAEIFIFDFTPGVVIKVIEERANYFDMYRNEINVLINSIKFYPDLKKN